MVRARLWTTCMGLITATLLWGATAAAQENLAVLDRWFEWRDAPDRLREQFTREAYDLLEQREQKLASLGSSREWEAYRDGVRRTLDRVVGPFPERTPLNARVLDVLEKDGYRVEKLVFESMPGFYVTGCLFLPQQRQEPAPAILNVIGHTGIAFRGESYQRFLLNLVRKGFIVLAIDPVGQGERLQYYDPEEGRSVVGGATAEHSYFGMQCFLTGSSAARYFTWDGIRAIDYLVSRPEVDADRIGVTGLSGGGTQTSYVMAMDDRVAAAAPTCYITGFRRLLESIGPQDAEQNFKAGLLNGIDHGDLLLARAPEPTLVVATTRDFFNITGTREVVAESRRGFEALGAAGHLALAEDDHGHGFTAGNNEATYAFFQEHLDLPGDPTHEEVEVLSEEELTVTPTGQLIDSLGGETVFSLNRAEAAKRVAALETAREEPASHLPQAIAEARRISGYVEPRPERDVVFRGRYAREGYRIEMYALESEQRRVLPLLLVLPDGVERPEAVLYLHPDGKDADLEPGGGIERLVRQGHAVLAADVAGVGELARAASGHGRYVLPFLGAQIGRSVVAARAADIVRCVRFLEEHEAVEATSVAAVGRGSLAVPLLHAAAWDERLDRIALIEPLLSYRAVAMNRFYDVPPADLVPGALEGYDLPDLAAALAPRPLVLVDPVDQRLSPAGADRIEVELDIVRTAYRAAGAADSLSLHHGEADRPLPALLEEWLGKSP